MTATPNRIPRRPNTGAPKFEADPLNSTYRWEFILTAGHPMNRVPILDGYSKGLGFENPNHVELLFKKLQNPILGYLDRSDAIVIYRQNTALPKQYHTVLLELYPHRFEAFDWLRETKPIMDWLTTFYQEYRRTGKMPPVEDRRKNSRQNFYIPELDHSKHQFRNMQELQEFCRKNTEKYSLTCMQTWYHKHAQFQPELFQEDVADALVHVAHTATTAEASQAARTELNNLYNRFPSNR